MIESRIKPLVAEFIGTFALIFIGVLSIAGVHIAGAPETMANLASIGLAHGLTIAVMVAALGAISGGHFNPAVTLGFVVTRRISLLKGAAYWGAQLLGASVAAVIISAAFGPATVAGATPSVAIDVAPLAAVVMEAVTTFFLVLVVFGCAVDSRAPANVYPLAIGLTVALDIMAIGPITGGAMNPARAFGPALAGNHWASQYVYWIGPLLGGALAALLYQWLMKAPAKKADDVTITLAATDKKAETADIPAEETASV